MQPGMRRKGREKYEAVLMLLLRAQGRTISRLSEAFEDSHSPLLELIHFILAF